MNRNEHASTSGIRSKAESEAAMHQKLNDHCHDAFKQYIAYCSGSNFNKWVDVIEKFPTQAYLMEKANWSHSER